MVSKLLDLLVSQLTTILSYFMQQIHLLNATETYRQFDYFLNIVFFLDAWSLSS